MVVYALLLIWAIVFKFSAISAININSTLPLGRRILNGLCFFDFFLSSNPWRLVRGLLIAMLNVLLFLPWGIYASFFYDPKRAVTFACVFALLVECIQLFARFGVFSFEDVALNTLGAFLGVLIFEKYIRHIFLLEGGLLTVCIMEKTLIKTMFFLPGRLCLDSATLLHAAISGAPFLP